MVEQNREVNFEPISDQICKIAIELTNNANKLVIIRFYAATFECSVKNSEAVDIFSNKLESVIKVIKKIKSRDILVYRATPTQK